MIHMQIKAFLWSFIPNLLVIYTSLFAMRFHKSTRLLIYCYYFAAADAAAAAASHFSFMLHDRSVSSAVLIARSC